MARPNRMATVVNDGSTPPTRTRRAPILGRVIIAVVIVTIAVVYVRLMVGPHPR